MSRRGTAASFLVICFAMATASPSAAQYSMAGKWGFEPNGGFPNLDLVQSGGTLTWNGSATPLGTIDESTGEFHLDFGALSSPLCGRNLLDGFVGLDSLTFTGTHSYGVVSGPTPHLVHCAYDARPIQGSRCGNGVMDPGEACEDDNGHDGDCCSSACQYDAPGAACSGDANQCTDDICDGGGTCLHPMNTGPCSDGCMDGTCSAGECVPEAPSPAGTPCNDSESCTVDDACDGAGACAPGAPRDCGVCGTCDWTGCRGPLECDISPSPAGPATLKMSIGEDAGRERLNFKVKDIVPPDELGDPAATTRYRLCVAVRDDSFLQIPRPVLAFELPVGGSCGPRDCWGTAGTGFRYKDKASTADGISSVVVGEKGFKFKGKGVLLPFASGLPTEDLLVQVLADDGVTTRCREVRLTSSVSTATEYRGGFKP